ncbi:MAG TPA: DEAD/DEAH box helicase [Solirubrobacteraceae bacterium]|jgi:superfamily II DNA or RNA helicase|nr:DEAD/DEAH box helicase [Solirubrobacteraceae bacterium]
MNEVLHASLEHDEAVLRFPYDDRLRKLLRTLPGRRWDPVRRAWVVPLDPDRAQALTLLFANLRHPPTISEALARALERRRRRRRHDEVLLDLARPNEQWWLTFATDNAPAIVSCLLEHPQAVELRMLERGLIPLDEHTAQLVDELDDCEGEARLSEDAEHALTELARRHAGPHALSGGGGALDRRDGAFYVDLGERFDLDAAYDPAAPPRKPRWHGTVDVDGPAGDPVFLLLGERSHLPNELLELAASAPGGASLPLTLDSWRAIQTHLRAFTSAGARRCVAALQQGRPAPGAVLELSGLQQEPAFALAPGHDHSALQAFAALPGATAAYRGAMPTLRADPFCVSELDALLERYDIWIQADALIELQRIREQHAHAAGLVALSAATDAALEVPGLVGELKPFQRAGVEYLLSQRRAFLADEQGLGKTIEALAAIEADGAYPAVVVCPASLKLNWLREIERWLPHRSALALHGTSAGGPATGIPAPGLLAPDGWPDGTDAAGLIHRSAPTGADITVVNYDIVAARERELAAVGARALVFDESHYCKNGAAKRTQAATRLAGSVAADGLVLALTGTPVMNRPNELISQLRIIGRLADFGSGAQFGERFRGADAHQRLHWHLRARCFVRRLKSEVLPQLPAKTRAIVPVELDNEGEYRLAERDVIAWLRSHPLDLAELDAKIAAALRAERLVRLGALKRLAARGKLHAALGWIHDFLSSGERLVVFASHREVQQAVIERFPHALHVLGKDSHKARDASVHAFQEADGAAAQLIVCSLAVAGQGLTLTKASNVAFLELDWTPAKHDQAEDRCHRIGQQDAVNAWYLLAAGTIDETIATLLERKRGVIGAVTDGRPEEDEAVVDALARELAGEPYRRLRAVA